MWWANTQNICSVPPYHPSGTAERPSELMLCTWYQHCGGRFPRCQARGREAKVGQKQRGNSSGHPGGRGSACIPSPSTIWKQILFPSPADLFCLGVISLLPSFISTHEKFIPLQPSWGWIAQGCAFVHLPLQKTGISHNRIFKIIHLCCFPPEETVGLYLSCFNREQWLDWWQDT